jgi:hypothetical protein
LGPGSVSHFVEGTGTMRAIIALTSIVGAVHLVRLGLRLAEVLCFEMQNEVREAAVIGKRVICAWRQLFEEIGEGGPEDRPSLTCGEITGEGAAGPSARNMVGTEIPSLDGQPTSGEGTT